MDTTVINVDKYGVYVPNIVFYWDSGMSKQRVAELTAIANKLRNKKVSIVYSANGDIAKDKRPIIVDIAQWKEELKPSEKDMAKVQTGSEPAQTKAAALHSGEEVPPAKESIVAPERIAGLPPTEEQHDIRIPSSDLITPAPQNLASITKDEATQFVRDIMDLTERKDLDRIMLHYADRVDYYNRGNVSLDYIKRDMGYYFRNWNRIMCSVEDEIELMDTDADNIKMVKFTSSFYVENENKYVIGNTSNVWKIQKRDNQLKIIDQKQKVINSESQ
jgi:hypothetical protein